MTEISVETEIQNYLSQIAIIESITHDNIYSISSIEHITISESMSSSCPLDIQNPNFRKRVFDAINLSEQNYYLPLHTQQQISHTIDQDADPFETCRSHKRIKL